MSSRKHPSQKRSRQTVARILEATQSLLVTDGIKAVTTNAIAERPGVELANAVRTNPKLAALDQEHDRRIAEMLHDDAVQLGITEESAEGRLRTQFVLQMALDLQSTVARAQPEENLHFASLPMRRFAQCCALGRM